jgi:hypothetical protein
LQQVFLQNQFTSCAFVWLEVLRQAEGLEMFSQAELELPAERARARVFVNK